MNPNACEFVALTLNPAWDCAIRVSGPLVCGAVHNVSAETVTAGGKGINVAKTLLANNRRAGAAGLLGADDAVSFSAEVGAMGIIPLFLVVPGRVRTNLMIGATNGEMKFNRPGFPELECDMDLICGYARKIAVGKPVVILSGSLPARFPAALYSKITDIMHSAGCVTVLDASGEALISGVAGRPAVIKPNRMELEQLVGASLTTDIAVERAVRRLAQNHEAVIVSDGPRGAWFASRQVILRGESPDVSVIDTTGAGDAMLGQFCADYFPGRRLTVKLAARALAAGAAAVEQVGTPVPDMQRILELSARTSPYLIRG